MNTIKVYKHKGSDGTYYNGIGGDSDIALRHINKGRAFIFQDDYTKIEKLAWMHGWEIKVVEKPKDA